MAASTSEWDRMVAEFIRITHDDDAWHGRFFDFVAGIFSDGNFRPWAARGGWDADYEVLAFVEGEQILASVGRSRMNLIVRGRRVAGIQLGAVATDRAHRGQGLSRRLIERILGERQDSTQPILLFANPSVLDFYPRFGFQRLVQRRVMAGLAASPGGAPARPADLGRLEERQRLAQLCRHAAASGTLLSAHNYYFILLWHLSCRPLQGFWLDEQAAFVAVERRGDRLVIHECLAPRRFALDRGVPRLIAAPIREVEFGFDPAGWWETPALASSEDGEALLFVQGDVPSGGDFRFPNLAQT